MKANKIEQGKQYEITIGKNTTIVRVVKIERRVNGALVFQCENVKTGKPMAVADVDRFRKEIKAEKKTTLKEAIESKGITVIPKGRRATSTMRDLDDPTFSRKHHVDENGVLVLETDDTATENETKTEPGKGGKPKGQLSGINAAYEVLKEAGEPMNIKQIMEKINERGLAKLAGKTPAATVSAALQREISTKQEASRFEKAGKGLFRAK